MVEEEQKKKRQEENIQEFKELGDVEERKVDERTPHAKNLFMAADSTMITVGGGYGLVSINGIAAFIFFHHVANLHVSK